MNNDQPEIWKRQLLVKIQECEKRGEAEISLHEKKLVSTWCAKNEQQQINGELFSRRRIETWLAFNELGWTLDQNSTDDGKYILRKNE